MSCEIFSIKALRCLVVIAFVEAVVDMFAIVACDVDEAILNEFTRVVLI